MKIEPKIEGNYYHIYNRGINSTNIFNESGNYHHFLRLYEKYINPVTETYAWCLMPNHFHLLVRIKELKEIQLNATGLKNPSGLRDPKGLAANNLSRFQNPKGFNTSNKNENFIITNQFSKLFNAYAKAFNKKYNRTGSLFEKSFERKKVSDLKYFKNLVYYIHNNPVHHGICERLHDYAWSSYGSIVSLKPTKIKREIILGHFNSVENFIEFHNQKQSFDEMNDLFFD